MLKIEHMVQDVAVTDEITGNSETEAGQGVLVVCRITGHVTFNGMVCARLKRAAAFVVVMMVGQGSAELPAPLPVSTPEASIAAPEAAFAPLRRPAHRIRCLWAFWIDS